MVFIGNLNKTEKEDITINEKLNNVIIKNDEKPTLNSDKCLQLINNKNITEEVKNIFLNYLKNPDEINEFITAEDIFDLFLEKFKKKYL